MVGRGHRCVAEPNGDAHGPGKNPDMPDAMSVRRQADEHPFGTLKAWMVATHLLTRTLDKVRTQMSLYGWLTTSSE